MKRLYRKLVIAMMVNWLLVVMVAVAARADFEWSI